MKELIARLQRQYDGLTARMESAVTAASAEGATAETVNAANADFDKADAERKGVKAQLDRAKQLDREQAEAAAQAAAAKKIEDETPARPAIVQQVHNPHPALAGGQRPAIPAQHRRHGALKAFRGADAEERAYDTGLWVAACMYGHGPSRERLKERGIEPQQTMSTVNNNSAAYFVPDVMDTAIIELTEQFGVVRRLADVVPMSSETWKGPRWTNGMTAYWVAQGAAPSQSEPGWDQISLVAKDLAAYGKQTRQLSEDALVDLGDRWAMAAAVAIAQKEDDAAFNGDGTSGYGGCTGLFQQIILAANSASLYTATGHSTLATLTLADFETVVGMVPNYAGVNPRWLCHKTVYYATMDPIKNTAGGATPADLAGKTTPTFLGYPVEFVNVAPKATAVTTGVTGILFGDMSLSTKFGDRRQRTLETGYINDDMIKQLITLFTAERVDIVNHTIIDPKGGGAGPIIGLKLA